jgi:hypothetical protein
MDRFGRFDAAYYRRFYEDPENRVYDRGGPRGARALRVWVRHLDTGSPSRASRHRRRRGPLAALARRKRPVGALHRYRGVQGDVQALRLAEGTSPAGATASGTTSSSARASWQYLPDPTSPPRGQHRRHGQGPSLLRDHHPRRISGSTATSSARTPTSTSATAPTTAGSSSSTCSNVGAGLWWPKDRPAPFYELELGQGTA